MANCPACKKQLPHVKTETVMGRFRAGELGLICLVCPKCEAAIGFFPPPGAMAQARAISDPTTIPDLG